MGIWEQLKTDMSKTNPKPNICHASTLGRPKSNQTGLFSAGYTTLDVALMMVWKTQIPAQCQ